MGWQAMLTVLVVVVVALVTAGVPQLPISDNNLTQRDEKLFLVVNPQACEGTGQERGACFPLLYCDKVGGVAKGTCCLGLGQCCIFEKSCGGSSGGRVTYFSSEASNATTADVCTVQVIKGSDVCQLRIEMPEANLAEPNAEGECELQYLEVVTGGSTSPLKICGNNAGQHLVVDVQELPGPYNVSVVNTQDNPGTSWQLQVEQLPCSSPDLAPEGCDQYYLTTEGSIQSFNYATEPAMATQADGNPGSRHLQESYSVCVKADSGSCGVEWSPAAGEDYAFTLTGKLVEDPLIPLSIFSTATDGLCPFTDHLVIPQGLVEGETTPSTVFCGSKFPDTVTSPGNRVTVVANGGEVADNDIDNRGFHLSYKQQTC